MPIHQFGFWESFSLVHLNSTALIKFFPVFCFQVVDYKHLGDLCLTQHEILSLPKLGDFLQETISITNFPVQKQTLDMSFLWFWDTYESRLVTNLSWKRNHPAASGALIHLLSIFISFLATSFTCVHRKQKPKLECWEYLVFPSKHLGGSGDWEMPLTSAVLQILGVHSM